MLLAARARRLASERRARPAGRAGDLARWLRSSGGRDESTVDHRSVLHGAEAEPCIALRRRKDRHVDLALQIALRAHDADTVDEPLMDRAVVAVLVLRGVG